MKKDDIIKTIQDKVVDWNERGYVVSFTEEMIEELAEDIIGRIGKEER